MSRAIQLRGSEKENRDGYMGGAVTRKGKACVYAYKIR